MDMDFIDLSTYDNFSEYFNSSNQKIYLT